MRRSASLRRRAGWRSDFRKESSGKRIRGCLTSSTVFTPSSSFRAPLRGPGTTPWARNPSRPIKQALGDPDRRRQHPAGERRQTARGERVATKASFQGCRVPAAENPIPFGSSGSRPRA
ncbi:hypothetical protein DA075_18940 [Methylobacterium currus]|uniref:Uncharacterized protein n=1 Tax=Methylobacterium currus TaxID=2051553 RepID=A0A2R4WME7_9HYPH|nr:hypothetical protein DA075_18940 [Methylobacterium currus]